MKFFENIKHRFSVDPTMLVVDAIDVILFAFLIYALFAFLKKNQATRLIKYTVIFLVALVGLSGTLLPFSLTSKVFGSGVVLLILAIGLLFPQELRRGLWKIASPKETQATFHTQYDCSDEELEQTIDGIVSAVLNMAKKDVGALIVITPETMPEHILESGTRMDALLSGQLLEALFVDKAPLHDGAVIVRGNRIMAAGCFLPLTQSLAVDKELGTRHRAGIGVTETNNVLTVIVSEETGVISTAHGGELKRYVDSEMLTDALKQVYGLKANNIGQTDSKKRRKKA